MENSKDISSSKTVNASIVSILLGVGVLLRAFGVELDLDEGNLTELVGALGIIATAGIAIWGRITATHILK